MVDAVAAATIALQRQPILRAEVVAGRPASGSVGDDSVAAVALRPVERLVGTPENGFRAVVGLRDRRDADRDGDLDGTRALEDGERLAGDAPPDALGH